MRPAERAAPQRRLSRVSTVAFVLTFGAAVLGQTVPVVPPVDTTRHSVPLEEIYFDTFDATTGLVRLTDASPELIHRLRDAIPPLHRPRYERVDEVRWLEDDDLVIGYAGAHGAWAYPVRILTFHEIVNEVLEGVPVLVSYCPLCASGVVFSRHVGDRVLSFGNTSALHEADMVMLDYETGSYWWQVAGRAIVGPLTDTPLEVLPSTTTSWQSWSRLHPNTVVLSRRTGYRRDYDRDPIRGYADRLNRRQFPFPVSRRPYGPLKAGTMVIVVRIGNDVRAYPIDTDDVDVVYDHLGNEPIVVFIDGDGGAAVFHARLPGAYERALTFGVDDDAIVDRDTASRWNVAGRAIEGPLAGRALQQLPSKTAYWFAVVASEPGVTVRRP